MREFRLGWHGEPLSRHDTWWIVGTALVALLAAAVTIWQLIAAASRDAPCP